MSLSAAARSLLLVALSIHAALAEPFVAVDRASNAVAEIVLPYDPATKQGFDWQQITQPRVPINSPEYRLRQGIEFLQEAVRRLTDATPAVKSGTDTSHGIIFVRWADAPRELRDDAKIKTALANDGSDPYNHREAFYLRSERDRLWIVANTIDGWLAAIPTLLETVDYEVLGMGPNWTYVPGEHRQRLAFDVELTSRPSYYLRQLSPTSGQSYGVGTISERAKLPLVDPADEYVERSYARWAIGIRNAGRSMPPFPGHAMQAHHRAIVEHMLRTGSKQGFLTANTTLGPDAARPAADETRQHHLWLNTDPVGSPGHAQVYTCDGKEWRERKLIEIGTSTDFSVPAVRQIVLAEMQKRAERHFAEQPDEWFVFGTEPEDGAGLARIGEWSANPQWYVEYLRDEKLAWPQQFVLHGYRGIDQPTERWAPHFTADHVFGFNNWLLREFDKWIDSLPPEQRVTSTGQSKKDLTRCSLYSYAYHDVPPHINLDPRIRVMIAGYPKHRGLKEWKLFPRQHDVAAAFKLVLPREPSGEYRIISLAYYSDHSLDGIPANWSAAPARIVDDLRSTYEAGIRALTYETDFNFGKYGLAYYLMSKVLWNANLTAEQLDSIRDRWLQRSFGSGWREMKSYYDLMLIDNLPVNAPAAWAKAIRLIDAADQRVDPQQESAAQRRIYDVKQYWYYYYLLDADKARKDSPELLEFTWKGQMSYMNAMHMVLNRGFTERALRNVTPEALRQGPAHYTSEETARWWSTVLKHWPTVDVTTFAESSLVNGTPGRDVDLNDLVRVTDFAQLNTGNPFLFNSAQAPPTTFLNVAKAGEPIGFVYAWPYKANELRFYGPKDVPYGVEWWDREQRRWTPIVDVTLTTVASQLVTAAKDGRERQVARVELTAPHTGTYRIEVGRGGFLATLAGLGFDVPQQTYQSRQSFTYPGRPRGLTQDAAYIYIPKGTKSLDLEVYDSHNHKSVHLAAGANAKGVTKWREVDISRRGTHRVVLEPGETGQLAKITGNGFAPPLLYSVPNLWAKSPAELVIPRAIASADGLTIAP
ncbi:MAG: hypothetical protein JNM18_08760 [Planctomycetaceae bacterium]|nr:hypothetical protein [Planctomycetaceae bacterium]